MYSAFFYLLEKAQTSGFGSDEYFFSKALEQAEKGMGTTHPNPSVGAVLAKNGQIVSEAHTEPVFGKHAEAKVLSCYSGSCDGATLYVTLEPCNHYGRTPPCTKAILEAGIKRVVYGVADQNPQVCGGGSDFLKAHGLSVEPISNTSLREKALALAQPFFYAQKRKRPYAVVKVATTKDGMLSLHPNTQSQISNEEAHRLAHRLRDTVDGVLVGAHTVRIDNPLLTVRLENRHKSHQPARIVCNTSLDLSPKSKIFEDGSGRRMVFHGPEIALTQKEVFKEQGVECVPCTTTKEGLDLAEVWQSLGRLGFNSIMVEAGARLFQSIVRNELANEIWWFTSEKIAGPKGYSATSSFDQETEASFNEHYLSSGRHIVGSDLLEIYRLHEDTP